MAKEILSVDDTHMRSAVNVSQLKRASGDNASGVDAATENAVAAQMAADGILNPMILPPTFDPATQSNIASDKITSVSASKKLDQRSEKIFELALGLQGKGGAPDKVNSLGDMMCELMLVMIQSTTERRKMEREMRTLLVTASVDMAEQIAKDTLEKMKHDVDQIKESAWGQVAASVAGGIFSFGSTMKSTKGKSFYDIRKTMGAGQTYGGAAQNFVSGITGSVSALDAKESARLEAGISAQQAALKLTRSVASSVEQSLKSIDSVRESLLSMISQISQVEHDGKMQIIRNSAV